MYVKKMLMLVGALLFPLISCAQTAQQLIGIVHNSPRADAEAALQNSFEAYFFGTDDEQLKITKAIKDFHRKYDASPFECAKGVATGIDIEELNRARAEAEQARTDLDRVNATVAQQQAELERVRRRANDVEKLQAGLTSAEEQLRAQKELLAKRGATDQQLTEALDKIRTLEDQLKKTQQNIDDAKAANARAEKVINELGDQNGKLREENARLRPENERLQKELREARTKGAQESGEQLTRAQERIAELERLLNDSQKEIARLGKQTVVTPEEVKSLREELAEKTKEKKMLEGQARQLSKENAELKKELLGSEQAAHELANLRSRNEALAKELENCAQEITFLKGRPAAEPEKVAELERELNARRMLIESQAKQIAKLEGNLETLRGVVDQQKEDLGKYKEKLAGLEAANKDLKEQVEDLQIKNEQSEAERKENERLSEENKNLKAQVNGYENRLKTAENEAKQNKEGPESALAAKEKVEREKNEAARLLAGVELDLGEANKEIKRLKSEIDRLNETMESMAQDYKKQKEGMKKELEDQEKKQTMDAYWKLKKELGEAAKALEEKHFKFMRDVLDRKLDANQRETISNELVETHKALDDISKQIDVLTKQIGVKPEGVPSEMVQLELDLRKAIRSFENERLDLTRRIAKEELSEKEIATERKRLNEKQEELKNIIAAMAKLRSEAA